MTVVRPLIHNQLTNDYIAITIVSDQSLNKEMCMSYNRCWVCNKDLNYEMPKKGKISKYREKCKVDKYLRQYCSNGCLKVDHK